MFLPENVRQVPYSRFMRAAINSLSRGMTPRGVRNPAQ
jgi:hypothetical protein